MKKLIIVFILFISGITFYSCSTDDKTIDILFDSVERGTVLRTLNATNTYNVFDVNDATFKFDLTVEAQNQNAGGDVTEVRLYQSFADNTDDGVDNSASEVLVETAPASSLSTSDNGFPSYSTSLVLADALAANGLNVSQVNGGDQFNYRLEVQLSDGRVFSSTANGASSVGGTVSGGSFFQSPFAYSVTVKCIPVTPFAGDYILDLVDSYGDGWDGAFITVTIDGVATDYTATGDGTEHTVTVPDGTASLSFVYTPGAFEGEHTYTITFDDGVDPVVAAEDGPGPTPGEIILNICK